MAEKGSKPKQEPEETSEAVRQQLEKTRSAVERMLGALEREVQASVAGEGKEGIQERVTDVGIGMRSLAETIRANAPREGEEFATLREKAQAAASAVGVPRAPGSREDPFISRSTFSGIVSGLASEALVHPKEESLAGVADLKAQLQEAVQQLFQDFLSQLASQLAAGIAARAPAREEPAAPALPVEAEVGPLPFLDEPAAVGELKARLEALVLASFRPGVGDIAVPVPAGSTVSDQAGEIDLEAMLKDMWRQASAEGDLEDPRQQAILERTHRWTLSLQQTGQALRAQAQAFHTRCLRAARREEGARTRQALERLSARDLERLLVRVAHAVEAQMPPAVGREGMGTLRIDWEAPPTAGWETAQPARPLPLVSLVRVCVESLGVQLVELRELLGSQLLADLREGRLVLPAFQRTPASTLQVTVLDWHRPEAALAPAEDLPPLEELLTEADAPAGGLAGWLDRDPELAWLCDLALCDAVYRDYYRTLLLDRPRQVGAEPWLAALRRYAASRPAGAPLLAQVELTELKQLVELLTRFTGEPVAQVAAFLGERLYRFRASAADVTGQQPYELALARLYAHFKLP